MRHLRSTLPLSALFLVGCSELSGLWLFEIETPGEDNEVCTETVDHNFTDATVIEDDGTDAYTSTRTTENSNSLAFVRFQDNGDGTGTLVMGNLAYPGTELGDGQWRFEWTGSSVMSQVDSHELGYDYTVDRDTTSVSTLTFTFAAESGSGDVTLDVLESLQYSESDTWSEEVMNEIGERGSIPAAAYLETAVQDQTVPTSNRWEDSDCGADECLLSIDSDCTTTWTATGYRTLFDDEEYDAVQNAGQAPGA